MIPLYKDQKNSPFIPNVQKKIVEGPKKYEKPFDKPYDNQDPSGKFLPSAYPGKNQSQPLVDLQVYNPPRPPPKKKPEINAAMYMPIPTQTPYFPPQLNPMWPYAYNPQLVAPVIKQYSINDGPFVNYSTLSVVKEDTLPGQFDNTSNSLGERTNIYNFVRSVFIKHYDGEDIDLDGKGNNSLLSYLKFLELNPYHKSSGKHNPYNGLPNDMVLYRSCYPIRYDEKTNSVQCAVNSIGMNIRIYKLSFAEYNIKKLKENNFDDYNIWREVAYYEYIREQVIKRKISPNFAIMYCYYISEKCNIDFNKIKSMNGSKLTMNDVTKAVEKADMTKAAAEDMLKSMHIKANIPPPIAEHEIVKPIMNKQCNDKLAKQDLDSYSGRGLVALTEAPTYNIYGWSSRKYTQEGNVHKMINTGYHTSAVWMSVLFQIMSAMYVMQLHKIAFKKFTIEDNVYIKDLTQHENVVTYWKYVINNFEYYVPNYGYLVMIDSNYKDVGNDYTLGIKSTSKDYKIYSPMFNNNTIDDATIQTMCFNAFKEVINPNTFTNAFTNYGGTPPPEDIKALLGKIYTEATATSAPTDISHYIYKCMSKLLNNRIGTYLNEIEVKNIRKDTATEFKTGQIVVMADAYERYKFCVFIKQENTAITVCTKENPKNADMVEINTTVGAIIPYSSHENIIQNYKPSEANLNEDELLETYVIA